MLIRFIKPWQNFAPPIEADLPAPVARVLIGREKAVAVEVDAATVAKNKRGRPRKEVTDAAT